jgi:hypothetical protein
VAAWVGSAETLHTCRRGIMVGDSTAEGVIPDKESRVSLMGPFQYPGIVHRVFGNKGKLVS